MLLLMSSKADLGNRGTTLHKIQPVLLPLLPAGIFAKSSACPPYEAQRNILTQFVTCVTLLHKPFETNYQLKNSEQYDI